jgi:hypothetical protein
MERLRHREGATGFSARSSNVNLAAAAFVLARQILTPADGKRRLFNPEP